MAKDLIINEARAEKAVLSGRPRTHEEAEAISRNFQELLDKFCMENNIQATAGLLVPNAQSKPIAYRMIYGTQKVGTPEGKAEVRQWEAFLSQCMSMMIEDSLTAPIDYDTAVSKMEVN